MKILCEVCCLVFVLIGLMAVNAMATPINSAASFSGSFLQMEVSSGQTTAFGTGSRVEAGRLKAGVINHSYDATDVKIVSSIPHALILNSTGIVHIAGFDGRIGFEYFNANHAAAAAGFPISAKAVSLPELAVIFLFGLALLGVGVMVRRKKSRAMLRMDRHPEVINTRQVTWPESIPQHIEAPPNMEAK